jgi:hypothetical protein
MLELAAIMEYLELSLKTPIVVLNSPLHRRWPGWPSVSKKIKKFPIAQAYLMEEINVIHDLFGDADNVGILKQHQSPKLV